MPEGPSQEMDRYPMVLVGDRHSGKTVQAFRWLAQGVQTTGYPGWSRVLVVATVQEQIVHKARWWDDLTDYDHRVYAMEELQRREYGSQWGEFEICLDNLDRLLKHGLDVRRLPGRVTAITMTARKWENQP